MAVRFRCLLWFAATILAMQARAADLVPGSPIRISIKNEYEATLDFGLLGKGSRNGTDTVVGELKFKAGEYAGIVTAEVKSTQTLAGPFGVSCGPGNYLNSQQLLVTGRAVAGFNADVQTVTFSYAQAPLINRPASTGTASEYLLLEFAPVPGVELQPPNPNPDQDQVIECHTVIETPAGRFLPLNDTRWTMEGGGYIIALPSFGALYYKDVAVPAGAPAKIGPFTVKKSEWTIEVERLP
jgi:hypothetical protein